jgi:hypothetical protein
VVNIRVTQRAVGARSRCGLVVLCCQHAQPSFAFRVRGGGTEVDGATNGALTTGHCQRGLPARSRRWQQQHAIVGGNSRRPSPAVTTVLVQPSVNERIPIFSFPPSSSSYFAAHFVFLINIVDRNAQHGSVGICWWYTTLVICLYARLFTPQQIKYVHAAIIMTLECQSNVIRYHTKN